MEYLAQAQEKFLLVQDKLYHSMDPKYWAMLGEAWCWSKTILALMSIFTIASYLVPLMWASILPNQNLKKKYKATWGLVTGSSSGIGKAIAERLAKMGLNVVLVAIDNEDLTKTQKELAAKYKDLEFRAIGVDLSSIGGQGYMPKIIEGTKDISIQCVFCNAGYLKFGSYRKLSIEDQLKNVECNAISATRVSQHFYCEMIKNKQRGCIAFTSSAAGYFPAPASIMYGAGKAYVSSLAASLAIEAAEHGIDVLACQPSYTRSGFYKEAPKLKIFEFLNIFGVESDDVAKVIINSLGRVTWRDTGGYALLTRIIGKFVDFNCLVSGMIKTAKLNPDYAQFKHIL
eukprot:tig00000248_g21773.t1